MSRSKCTSILIALVLLLSAALARAQQPQPIALIAIDWNAESPSVSPRNSDLIYKTLRAALADILKKKLNVADPATIADLDMMGEGRNLRLIINPKGAAQPTPDEILAVVKEDFLGIVNNFFVKFHEKEIVEMREQDDKDRDMAARRAAQAQDRLAQLRSQLRSITHRVDVSPETLRAAITRLEDERDKLALDSESMTVRKKAIQDTIAEITVKGAAEMKNDRIAVELDKLIQSRETDLKRMQQLAAEKNISQAELEASQARLAEARVRLWERQEVVNKSAGGDLLGDLNKELAMLSINSAESQHRLERLQKAVDDYSKAVDLIDELENAQAARQAAQQSALETENRVAEHQRTLRQLQPPTVNLHVPGRP